MPITTAFFLSPRYSSAFEMLIIHQGDQRLPHDSGKDLDISELGKLGVLYYRFNDVDGVNKLAQQRGYKNRDEITVSPEKMGDIYEEKVKSFFARTSLTMISRYSGASAELVSTVGATSTFSSAFCQIYRMMSSSLATFGWAPTFRRASLASACISSSVPIQG